MRTVAQSVSPQLQPLLKICIKGKPKPQPTIKPLNNSKIQVQINRHKVLDLVHLETKEGDSSTLNFPMRTTYQ